MTWPEPDDDWTDLDDDGPAAPVVLSEAHRTDLVAALHSALSADGCDNTLRAAERWARATGVVWPAMRRQLEENGGYCDCEILFNVFPDEGAGWD